MLPQFELDVREAAERGQISEAMAMIKGANHISCVRRLWLEATVLMYGGAQERIEALERLDKAISHPWANQEPDTLALAALELSLFGFATNRKMELEKAKGIAIRLESEHGDDHGTMQWVARVWLNIGNRALTDGRLDEAADALRRVLSDQHPDNWCTRFSSLCLLAWVAALKGDPRPDLLETALGVIPVDRQGYGESVIMLTQAFVSYAKKEMAVATRQAEKARVKAAASTTRFTQAHADLLLLRIAVETGKRVEPALLARIGEWGDSLPFVPFLASKIFRGKEGTICVAAAASR